MTPEVDKRGKMIRIGNARIRIEDVVSYNQIAGGSICRVVVRHKTIGSDWVATTYDLDSQAEIDEFLSLIDSVISSV